MLKAAVLVFPDVEVLDFAGPFEVLASARAPGSEERRERARAFEVFTVAARGDPITCRGGLVVQPNRTFADCPPVDVVVVPGGYGVLQAIEDAETRRWVREAATGARITASVCTGAFLLASAGLLDGQPATTHWAEIEAMRERFPRVQVRDDYRVVETGRVITSAGVSAGLDMALHLIGRLFGREAARETARSIEYRWEPVPTLTV
ncbi:MAG TPA: DJ-1/PfpI family protein [Chloroflexota bacterium]|jgi:transcriptional regulator GlxA family with amidase domain